ncbi:ATP-binding cassette domain-containing protein [Erwinia sp. V71]|uniref:ATP-binding cassette domain-containing protein n=1 Tax=Erwinia sp. V71 TaxID=3369424 RepID=UPI003F634D34
MLTSLSPTPDKLLQLTHLDLAIQQQTRLHQLSFSLQRGEAVCLLGESGCGKSLTASAIVGALPAHATLTGELQINGESVVRRPVGQRHAGTRAALIFQDAASALNPLMNVGKQLTLTLRAQHSLTRQQASDEAQALLVEMGFDDAPRILRCYPAELSGGQRQRVCIALALASRSPLIVADEPTSALDVATQQTVIAAFQRLLQRPDAPALLFITHDLVLAAQLCRRALVMSEGRLVEDVAISQLLLRPQHTASQRLVKAARAAEQLLERDSPLLRGIA